MNLSGIIFTKTSKSPGKSGVGLRSGNKLSQNTFKTTPEDALDTFYDIISHLTSKYHPEFLGLQKLLDRTGLWRTLIKREGTYSTVVSAWQIRIKCQCLVEASNTDFVLSHLNFGKSFIHVCWVVSPISRENFIEAFTSLFQ